MTEQEYNAERKLLEDEFEAKKRALAVRCANENNPYKTGDIVKDHVGGLQIESVRVRLGYNSIPECVYFGIELKKDGTPMKNQTGRAVHQTNILK